MKTFLTILITLIVAGAAAGAGAYYWEKSKCDDAKDKLEAEVSAAESACATSDTAATTSSSGDCTVYSYSNTTYGISFNYPKNWLVEGRENKASSNGTYLSFTLTDTPVLEESDMLPAVALYLYSSISKLDEENLGATDLNDYLDKYSATDPGYYSNVTSATVAGKSGYSADEAGNGMFEAGSGKYYFLELTGGKILKIWDLAESTDTKIVIDSISI